MGSVLFEFVMLVEKVLVLFVSVKNEGFSSVRIRSYSSLTAACLRNTPAERARYHLALLGRTPLYQHRAHVRLYNPHHNATDMHCHSTSCTTTAKGRNRRSPYSDGSVAVLDSGAEGPGFKSQPRRSRVTVLGKLFTPIVPLFTKQRNW